MQSGYSILVLLLAVSIVIIISVFYTFGRGEDREGSVTNVLGSVDQAEQIKSNIDGRFEGLGEILEE